MSIAVTANGTALPSPVEITAGEEIIWSADTGRAASGAMVGTVVAEKRTLAIRWGVLTAAQYETIRGAVVSGFIPFTITIDGAASTMTVYRGTITGDLLGTFGGTTYYKSASVTVIQQ